MSPGNIRVGISGWRYPAWRGAFYPEGMPQRRELEYASRALSSIELNGSFYSLQRPESYARWYAETPPGFLFSVKGPRYMTHILRLRNVETPLANFLASGVANLREKLGPVLWQLPASLAFDVELIDAFLCLLPHDTDAAAAIARRHDDKVSGRARLAFGPHRTLRHALEARHESFVDPRFIDLLRKHRVAFVIADTAGKWPEYEDVTADFVYIRLHGAKRLYVSGYADQTLERWSRRIRQWRAGREPRDARRISPQRAPPTASRDVYCYFDNTATDAAPRNALSLARKLKITPGRDAGGSAGESSRRSRR
ncbi:MAG TPA: DUF72 domain-containing protein [Casimicrobiaceae bacterium]